MRARSLARTRASGSSSPSSSDSDFLPLPFFLSLSSSSSSDSDFFSFFSSSSSSPSSASDFLFFFSLSSPSPSSASDFLFFFSLSSSSCSDSDFLFFFSLSSSSDSALAGLARPRPAKGDLPAKRARPIVISCFFGRKENSIDFIDQRRKSILRRHHGVGQTGVDSRLAEETSGLGLADRIGLEPASARHQVDEHFAQHIDLGLEASEGLVRQWRRRIGIGLARAVLD